VICIPTLVIYLPNWLYDEISRLSKEQSISTSKVIQALLIEALAKKESSEESVTSSTTNVRKSKIKKGPRERIKVVGEKCSFKCKYYEDFYFKGQIIPRCTKFNKRVELVHEELGGDICPYFVEREE